MGLSTTKMLTQLTVGEALPEQLHGRLVLLVLPHIVFQTGNVQLSYLERETRQLQDHTVQMSLSHPTHILI